MNAVCTALAYSLVLGDLTPRAPIGTQAYVVDLGEGIPEKCSEIILASFELPVQCFDVRNISARRNGKPIKILAQKEPLGVVVPMPVGVPYSGRFEISFEIVDRCPPLASNEPRQ